MESAPISLADDMLKGKGILAAGISESLIQSEMRR